MNEWREDLDREIEHLREKIEIKLAERQHAVELQAEENLRRLKELNHEAERIRAAAERSVSSEKYEANRETDQMQRQALRRRMTEFRESVIADRNRRTGAIAVLVLLASLLAKYLLP